jgi:hypothetical protein
VRTVELLTIALLQVKVPDAGRGGGEEINVAMHLTGRSTCPRARPFGPGRALAAVIPTARDCASSAAFGRSPRRRSPSRRAHASWRWSWQARAPSGVENPRVRRNSKSSRAGVERGRAHTASIERNIARPRHAGCRCSPNGQDGLHYRSFAVSTPRTTPRSMEIRCAELSVVIETAAPS